MAPVIIEAVPGREGFDFEPEGLETNFVQGSSGAAYMTKTVPGAQYGQEVDVLVGRVVKDNTQVKEED